MTIDGGSVWVLSVFSQRKNSADHNLITETVMLPSPEVVRIVPKKFSGGRRQRFFVRRVGCLGAKCVRRVEEEINGRCSGVGVLTLP